MNVPFGWGRKSSFGVTPKETSWKNNVQLVKESDSEGLQSSQKRNNSATLDGSPLRGRKRRGGGFGLLFSLLSAVVLPQHKDWAKFLNIAHPALPCRSHRLRGRRRWLNSCQCLYWTATTRAGVLLTASLKTHWDAMAEPRGPGHLTAGAAHGKDGNEITCIEVRDPHKYYHNRRQKGKRKKTKEKTFQLDYKNTFRISLKYLKMYSIRFFFPFFFLQSHASTCIFIIIITLIWMIYRIVIIIVI